MKSANSTKYRSDMADTVDEWLGRLERKVLKHGGTEKGGASGKLCRELGRSAVRKRPQKSGEPIVVSKQGNACGAKGFYV